MKSVYFVLLSVQLENSLVFSWWILSSVHEKFDVSVNQTAEINYSGRPKYVLGSVHEKFDV